MQLRLDAADRLVELVEERRGPVVADEAARRLFALRQAPVALARSLLAEVVESDARLAWNGDAVGLARPLGADLLLEEASYVVVDLETTGLRPGSSQICEIGAVLVQGFELVDEFETLVDPRVPLGATVPALPDAQATAEVLLALIGLAQERGARTVAELVALAATRTRRVWDKRELAHGAPPRPGVYLFYDRNEQLLYVGRARDLRARLRSYFRSDRQRPAVEAALGAVARIEWRVLGSELEAALEELRLIRELRPPANARIARPDRYVWLRKRGDAVVCSSQPTELGPIKGRRRAQLAARALQSVEWETIEDALPKLRAKLKRLARDLRFEG